MVWLQEHTESFGLSCAATEAKAATASGQRFWRALWVRERFNQKNPESQTHRFKSPVVKSVIVTSGLVVEETKTEANRSTTNKPSRTTEFLGPASLVVVVAKRNGV